MTAKKLGKNGRPWQGQRAHSVGVCRTRCSLIRADQEHEATIQNHQPPVIVLEDGHLQLCNWCQPAKLYL